MGFFVPVHPDGHKFVAIAVIASVIGFLFSSVLGLLLFIIVVYVAYFFRDPERVVPQRAGLILAAGDGRVSMIEEISPPEELGLGPDLRLKVSIFLSIFDVHIQRAPVSGEIINKIYTPGLFLNAELDKASEDNERSSMVIETIDGEKIAVVQIAGLIARRIIGFVKKGQRIGVGERFGLIRFGSRVDVYLPVGTVPLVAVGQKAIGGETVIADLKASEALRETRVI
ncbi:MAG: phosphatidylserine decarboxylase [Hyphomicrobiaceae bacterium]|nr:phosphatidylserine decarboxylase [Hyphomicrobiaceae bacterium]